MNDEHKSPRVPKLLLLIVAGLVCAVAIQANSIKQLSEASIQNSEAIISLSEASIKTTNHLTYIDDKARYMQSRMMTWENDGNDIMHRISGLQNELDILNEQMR